MKTNKHYQDEIKKWNTVFHKLLLSFNPILISSLCPDFLNFTTQGMDNFRFYEKITAKLNLRFA